MRIDGVKDEYCVVLDSDTRKPIIALKFDRKGNIETIHIVKKYTRLADIPLNEVPEYKEDSTIIENYLYNVNGKVKLGKNIK